MKTTLTRIHAPWIIPVEPAGVVLENHCLVINSGRIEKIMPEPEGRRDYPEALAIELDRHILIPGLVNAHTHAAMSLFRGLADDLPLMEWLNSHIWPAEQAFVGAPFVRDGSELAIAEMLRSGTTCFNDMYFFADETARVAQRSGIRAMLGMIIIDFPTVWAQDADEYIHKGLELHDEYRNHSLIKTAFAPHAPYTVSDSPLQRVVTLAEELDVPVHMHVHETETEVAQAEIRPLERLDALALLSPRLMAVHMTQLSGAEIEKISSYGCHVVHCPESNLKLASGFCPVASLENSGVNVALGTDGAASNNDLDMLGEMRTSALLAKGVANDASAVPAAQALRMATLNGAKALGLGDEIGSLVEGKSADLVAVEVNDIESLPMFDPCSHLVYATSRDQVTDVWVSGQHLLKSRKLTTLDEEEIAEKATRWGQRIMESR